jgi:hypothetical protein
MTTSRDAPACGSLKSGATLRRLRSSVAMLRVKVLDGRKDVSDGLTATGSVPAARTPPPIERGRR